MLPRDSLFLRLIVSSAAWIVLTLLLTGVLVVYQFHSHIRDRLERQLADHLEELVAASEIAPGGGLALTWRPADPRFNRPLSGWYWQISDPAGGGVLERSASLVRGRMSLPGDTLAAARSGRAFGEAAGPDGRALHAIVRTIGLPRADRAYRYIVAGPPSDIASDVALFARALALVLGILSVFLLVLIWIQVGFGLRPFARLRASLAAIRAGEVTRLPDDFPREVRGLVGELNALMDYNETLLSRARAQVANLAHAIKNPLAILANDAKAVEGERGERMQAQVRAVSNSVGRYLQHARIAGTKNVLGVSSDAVAVCRELVEALTVLYREKGVAVSVTGADALPVRVEAEDLVELLGNLMDNAAKWARGTVSVDLAVDGADPALARIAIDDDGPGIPADRRDAVMKRGVRLDERAPGDGFGLSIAGEIADLYGGAIALGESPLGGLRVVVGLPLAGRRPTAD